MKVRQVLFALACCAVAACARQEIDAPIAPGFKKVSLQASVAQVKSTIADDGTFAWSEGDVISVYATDGKFYDFTLVDGQQFDGVIPESAEITTVAAYPVVAANGTNDGVYADGVLNFTLPTEITVKEGCSNVPMVASFEKGAEKVAFKQVGAAFKFLFTNAPKEFYADVTFDGAAPVGTFTVDPTAADATLVADETGAEKTVTLHIVAEKEGDEAVAYIPVATGSWPDLHVKLYNGDQVYYESDRTRSSGEAYSVGRADIMVMDPLTVVPSSFAELDVPMTSLPNGCVFVFESEYGSRQVDYTGEKEGTFTFSVQVPVDAAKGKISLTLPQPDGRALFVRDITDLLPGLSEETPYTMEAIDAVLAEIAYVEERHGGENSISFMHISDLHSKDVTINKLASLVKATDVPFSVMTGDMYFTFEEVKTSRSTGKPIYVIPGNHDVYQYYGGWRAAGLYPYEPNYCFRYEHLDRWFSQSLKDYSIYGSDKACYFYYDFKAGNKTFRFIGLDQYDGGTAGWSVYNANIISQEEADWLIDLLGKSEDVDGIAIFGHAGYGNENKGQRDVTNTGEFISVNAGSFTRSYDYVGPGDPYLIPEIVQAYISGENLDKKEFLSGADHRDDGSDVPAEKFVTVTTAFTRPHTNFIGYFGGHLHWDEIEYLKDFPQQLQLQIAHGGPDTGTEWNDLTREDAAYTINYYVVNFDTKLLTVHRIGSRKTSAGTYRLEQTFPLGQ